MEHKNYQKRYMDYENQARSLCVPKYWTFEKLESSNRGVINSRRPLPVDLETHEQGTSRRLM